MRTIAIALGRLDTAGWLTDSPPQGSIAFLRAVCRLILTLRVLPLKRFLERTSNLQLLKSKTVFSQGECLSSRIVYLKGKNLSRKGAVDGFLYLLKGAVFHRSILMKLLRDELFPIAYAARLAGAEWAKLHRGK